MSHGIEPSDRFGASAIFVAQSMAQKYGPLPEIDRLLEMLVDTETPRGPDVPTDRALLNVDRLIDWVEYFPHLFDLIDSFLDLAVVGPPTHPVSQRLFRSVMWVSMRKSPGRALSKVLEIFRNATPGATFRADQWPPHEFFAALTVLVYLGGDNARWELQELLDAAKELGHHDLAPILDWYLDRPFEAPSR